MWKITGQGKNVELLRHGLETGLLSHAYIFTGPAHSGKMTLAINLAGALNCREADPPCGECDSCRKVEDGKHADVNVIAVDDPLNYEESEEKKQKTEIGINRIRKAQHSASLPPLEGRCRVFIINRAELLSLEAANSLLKTLEEPEKNVVFILLTANEKLLPETVVSRCQVIRLVPTPAAVIEDALINHRGVEPDRARLLASLSHGCPGWAVSAAGDDTLLQQRTEALDEIVDMIESGAEERFACAARLAADFGKSRDSVYDRLELWLDLWRDLMLVRAGSPENITNIDRLDYLAGTANNYSLEEIKNYIRSIQAAGEQLRRNANSRMALEVMMLDIPEGEKQDRSIKAAV